MFRSARIKLTAWYLLIIMVISAFFSAAIYRALTFELDRFERAQRLRIENQFEGLPPVPRQFRLDPDLVEETKNRLKLILGIIDLVILGGAAVAGYFLAGRTLRPIAEMVDEQGRFITDASHELRTPLTSLKLETEVNLRDQKLTLKQAKSLLKSNLEEINNLQILSDDLIKLTQYQSGGNDLAMAAVSLAEITHEAIRKVSGLARGQKITIVNKVKDLSFKANKATLVELLVIFLDNAIKYSPSRALVTLTTEKKSHHVLVAVTDQGMGIDKKDLPHLFDRFYRADKSRTKSDAIGYGLGLSIAKQIVDRHHGLITVKSSLGKGTTFTVQLPS